MALYISSYSIIYSTNPYYWILTVSPIFSYYKQYNKSPHLAYITVWIPLIVYLEYIPRCYITMWYIVDFLIHMPHDLLAQLDPIIFPSTHEYSPPHTHTLSLDRTFWEVSRNRSLLNKLNLNKWHSICFSLEKLLPGPGGLGWIA